MTRFGDGARDCTTRLDRRRFLAVSVAASAATYAGMVVAGPGPAPGIATAPNPHMFPLILAMSLNPSLPLRLLPITESRDADALFASGQADAMLAELLHGGLVGARPVGRDGLGPAMPLHQLLYELQSRPFRSP